MSEHFKRGKFFKTEDTAIPKIGYFLYEGQHWWLGMLMAAACQRLHESPRLLTCSAAQKRCLRRPDFITKFYFKLSASNLVLSSDCCQNHGYHGLHFHEFNGVESSCCYGWSWTLLNVSIHHLLHPKRHRQVLLFLHFREILWSHCGS